MDRNDPKYCDVIVKRWVALLTESVDRNSSFMFAGQLSTVALLTESVDRNIRWRSSSPTSKVALLTESVDRNAGRPVRATIAHLTSLSSRRAWIEMVKTKKYPNGQPVALLTESVDRNASRIMESGTEIEVALLTESVDRNIIGGSHESRNQGRSPHGERG